MFVQAVLGGPLLTNGYLVYERPGDSAMIVDAPLASTRRFLEALGNANLHLLYIVNTHGHWDHTADNSALQKATGAALCVHSWDATRLANPSLAGEDETPLPVPPSRADRTISDGDCLEVGSYRFEVIHAPGHSPGSICLYEANVGVLFTGDTLLCQRAGTTNFPGGSAEQLCKTYVRLAALPDSTAIYPGHGPGTTIGRERWLLELAAT